ncbi:MAG TPA: class I SAM-dependent methyltransferase [Candidatus Nanoarchaeia archaeon]|nr:class I SAM-dependent methyltransferase [Candidatus Woesearchaeota archaeon]HIH13363.1 class I SAM-dependent methyltransferase [Candidatus Woesearchaeota archaeon]HLC71732.1 class I SAM-dependent methyltransferase [Candidatus Nanoarchaeia archaeon]
MDSEVKVWNKIAKKYAEEIISPFSEGVTNPIFWYLENKIGTATKEMSVIDIGCGIGNFLPTLAQKFSKVVGIDFSPKMIETATAQAKDFPNVSLFVRDGRDLHEFHNQFDVAVTVNSILLPKVKDCEKMIQEAYNLLKDGGIILGIFPAMESHLYRALLIQEKTLDDGETEEIAIQKAKEDVGDSDLVTGLVPYEDTSIQKNYYLFEIKHRLWKAGFTNISVRKVYYPWEIHDEESLLAFKKKKKLWDWFVYATKQDKATNHKEEVKEEVKKEGE